MTDFEILLFNLVVTSDVFANIPVLMQLSQVTMNRWEFLYFVLIMLVAKLIHYVF